MPVYLKKMPTATLDVRTGQIQGLPQQAQAPQNELGIPPEELVAQIVALAKKGIPLAKIMQAIEQHPDIVNKPVAKQIAQSSYPSADLSTFVGKQ